MWGISNNSGGTSGDRRCGSQQEGPLQVIEVCFIAVCQSTMQQSSLPWWIPERSTFDWERLFPHGGRWGYMMLPIGLTTCGESGVFGNGGGKNEIFGWSPSKFITTAGEYFPNETGFSRLVPIVIFPAIPPLFPTKFKYIARTQPSRLVLKALVLAP